MSVVDIETRRLLNEAINCFNTKDHAGARTGILGLLAKIGAEFPPEQISEEVLRSAVALSESLELWNAYVGYVRAFGAHHRAPTCQVVPNFIRFLVAGGERARPGDFIPEAQHGNIAPTTLIACFPKSGSTFLSECLTNSAGVELRPGVFAYQQSEQELYLPQLLNDIAIPKVIQQHCRGTPANVALTQAFDMRVVILVRNIFDALVSFYDMIQAGGVMGSQETFVKVKTLDADTVLDAVVTKYAHWYIEFFVSWTRALNAGEVNGRLQTYENMIADKPATVHELSQFAGFGVSRADVDRTIQYLEGDRERIRFNKGVRGRGRSTLTDRQVEYVTNLTNFYPDVDFSVIGL